MDDPVETDRGRQDVIQGDVVVRRRIRGRFGHAGEYGSRHLARWTSGRARRGRLVLGGVLQAVLVGGRLEDRERLLLRLLVLATRADHDGPARCLADAPYVPRREPHRRCTLVAGTCVFAQTLIVSLSCWTACRSRRSPTASATPRSVVRWRTRSACASSSRSPSASSRSATQRPGRLPGAQHEPASRGAPQRRARDQPA